VSGAELVVGKKGRELSDAEVAQIAARADQLYQQVFAPLLLGGEVRPVRPIGPLLSRQMAGLAHVFQPSDSTLWTNCDEARRRQARLLAPVDDLPAPGPAEWLMLAALNDLLQVANPYLPSVMSPSRPAKLLETTLVMIGRVPPPSTLNDCLGRHASFAQVLGVGRLDTTIRWWTGSAVFHGEAPSKRLMAWPEVRRVRVDETVIGLDNLMLHPSVTREQFLGMLGSWLRLSPLTDLACAGREEPRFQWGPGTLGLVATPAGARLGRRALRGGGARGDVALERATKVLESQGLKPALEVASRFLDGRRAHAALSP
jgi:hypothetical protein